MCLHEKVKTLDVTEKILGQCKELKQILEEIVLKEKLEKYELVRQQGYYNMLDKRARKLSGLTEDEYQYILENYTKLISKFPEVKQNVERRLEYMKSAEISKVIALGGCKNCIEIVSKKLDVKVEDLCQKCQQLICQKIKI